MLVHHYDSETKHHFKEWKHSGFPQLMKSVAFSFFGQSLPFYLEEGKTITGSYYTKLLNILREKIVEKRHGKLAKCVLFARQYFCSQSKNV